MKTLNSTTFLFIVIALEGYIILSAELLAMRIAIPFVGTGTDVISLIIASVLMPLAFGYQAGARFQRKNSDGQYKTIRRKLLENIVIASVILVPGLSYFILQFFFYGLAQNGIENTILQISIYCLVFLVYPVFLLGQTVPLVCHYFSEKTRSRITGRMLFFSTAGSFCGSIFTTLILMDLIGMHHTVSLLFALLLLLTLILTKKQTRNFTLTMIAVFGFSLFVNSDQVMKTLNVIENNKYSTIMVFSLNEENEVDENGHPHLFINNNDSSMFGKEGQKHPYIEFAEQITIESLPEDAPPKDVLIIGAGGFTFGHGDLKNNFIYLDIDKDLKPISEKHLLGTPLQDNKIFHAVPARAFLAQTDQKFDVVLLDAYLGGLSIPEHLVTKEFFTEVKEHMAEDAVLVANFIVSPNFGNIFSKNIDNTMRTVFPYISRHNTEDEYDVWNNSDTLGLNFMYIYKHVNIGK